MIECQADLIQDADPGSDAIVAWIETAQVRKAIVLLRGYVASGQVGSEVENHCRDQLAWMRVWFDASKSDPSHEPRWPEVDEAAELRRCLALDRRRAASPYSWW